MRARIIGVEAQMLKFEFLLGVRLGALILRHSDNLSSTLQHKNMSAAEGQRLAQLSLSVLKKMRCDEDFSAFINYFCVINRVLVYLLPAFQENAVLPNVMKLGLQLVLFMSLWRFTTGRFILEHWTMLSRLFMTDLTNLGAGSIRNWSNS